MLAVMVVLDDEGKLQVQGCDPPIALALLNQAVMAVSSMVGVMALDQQKKSMTPGNGSKPTEALAPKIEGKG